MKRNIFLLSVCILMLALLKQTKSNVPQRLEPLHVFSPQTIDLKGTLFIPKTIRPTNWNVNKQPVVIIVNGRNYIFERRYRDNTYWNVSEDRELRLSGKVTVTSSAPVKLFIARDLM